MVHGATIRVEQIQFTLSAPGGEFAVVNVVIETLQRHASPVLTRREGTPSDLDVVQPGCMTRVEGPVDQPDEVDTLEDNPPDGGGRCREQKLGCEGVERAADGHASSGL